MPPGKQSKRTSTGGWKADPEQAAQQSAASAQTQQNMNKKGWQPDGAGAAESAARLKAPPAAGWRPDAPNSAVGPQSSQFQTKSGWQPDRNDQATETQKPQPPAKRGWQPNATEQEKAQMAKQYLGEGLRAAKSGNFQLAALKFQEVVKLSPSSASAWSNLGLTLKKTRKARRSNKRISECHKDQTGLCAGV